MLRDFSDDSDFVDDDEGAMGSHLNFGGQLDEEKRPAFSQPSEWRTGLLTQWSQVSPYCVEMMQHKSSDT